MIRTVIVVALPDDRGWCFSTKHTDLEIEDAMPVSYYIGSRYRSVQDVYRAMRELHGPLFFNPVPALEPDYSVDYVNEMLDWWEVQR